METLVLLDQQQYVRQQETRIQNPINCRSSQSRTGVFPPFAFTSGGCRGTELVSYGATGPSYQSTGSRGTDRSSKNRKIKCSRRSSPITIASKNKHGIDDLSFALGGADFSASPSSERWAGPTYSNSPPPSSLPIPKFSLREKRSVSLELPGPETELLMTPVVKSAPPSPSRDPHFSSSGSASFLDAASATKNLRRILHLDLQDN